MTMICFNVKPDRAEVMTDSLTYNRSGRHMGRSSKVDVLADLNTVVTSYGSHPLGAEWRYLLDNAGQWVDDFDGLDALAEEHLPEVWAEMADYVPDGSEAVVFHIGYSPRHNRFKAYAYPSANGFRCTPLGAGLHVMPAPTSVDSTLALMVAGSEVVTLDGLDPAGLEDWTALAETIHADRSAVPYGTGRKVFIGGDIVHTRLERGAVTQRRIHHIGEDSEGFRRMVSGTMHPLGQLGPCVCGSGETFATCHLPAIADQPCVCRSGQSFAECCRIEPPTKAGRNEPCPCSSGRKYKKCCALVAA